MKKISGVFIITILIIVGLWRVPMASALNKLFPAGGGDLTPLLAGVWDCRKNRTTVFYVNNATSRNWLLVWFNFYDNQEHPTGCRVAILSPNDVVEVDARFVGNTHFGKWGKVKIASWWWPARTAIQPFPFWRLENGIKGFQKEVFSTKISLSQKNLGPSYYSLAATDINHLTEANLEEIPVATLPVATLQDTQDQALLVEDPEIFDQEEFLTIAQQTTDGILYDMEVDESGELCKKLKGMVGVGEMLKGLAGIGITKVCPDGIDRIMPKTPPLLTITCPISPY